MSYWPPGTQIEWRYGDGWIEPMTVVRDDADGLVAWLAEGTPVRRQLRADGRGVRADKSTMFTCERVSVLGQWTDHDVLRIAPAGRWWSVWAFFEPISHAFEGWYVNIEDPHVRSARTVSTRDHVLDLWVEPDRSHRRKDEDELEMAVEQGRYTAAQAAAITAVADEVEAILADWGSPFCDRWERFRPDPAWPVPDLL